MDYALIVISPIEKRLSIYPCGMNERDAVRLRSGGINPDKPRQVRCCNDFSEKMLSLMQWSREYRYRMIGYVAKGNRDTIIVFDLSSSEVFASQCGSLDAPARLQEGFGAVFDEHRNNPPMRTMMQDTVITLAEMGDSQNDNH